MGKGVDMSTRIRPGGKVFRDPIHQLIRIDTCDSFALDLIDTPEFQRLRRVRQLGVSWITYPGAEHSRFSHSLGVFNFVQRMLEVLCRRYVSHDIDTYLRKHARVVKAAALLHDIGHGPFSHMIERAFGKHSNHEAMTVAIIKDPKSAVGSALTSNGIDPNEVADLIDHTSSHALLMDLVSSQLDADRMDYLLRDSYSTGVQYGLYDSEWLLNAMCVGRNPREVDPTQAHPNWRLALDERRGEKAAEQFILARAHMNEQVYFHRVTRGFETMLLALFQLAGKLAKKGELPESTPAIVTTFFSNEGKLDLDAWLGFDESVLLAAMHVWSKGGLGCDPELSRLSGAFLNRKRLFGCVAIGSLGVLESPRLFSALSSAGLEQGRHWFTEDIDSAVYKGILYASRSAEEDEEETLVESILLASGDPKRKAKPIENSSKLMEHLGNQRQRVVRLFFDRSRQKEVLPVLAKFKLEPESNGDES